MIENVHCCLKVLRDYDCSFFLREKNPDIFLVGICSWNEKMCFWLAFSFSQDSRFILSVRRSKRNEELSGILFHRCVLCDSTHLLDFFSRIDSSQFFQIYMMLEMEGPLESIRRFSKGISFAFWVGQYFRVRDYPVLKMFSILGL